MALTTCSVTTSVIAALDDLPNDVGGLTAAQLKAKFDEFGTNFVDWFNETHIPEVDAAIALTASETRAGVVELATAAETTTGTDDTRAVHPKGLKVELDKKLSLAGGTMTGALVCVNSTSYTTAQARNIILSTASASGGGNGDIWIQYTA
jgi:hypothetical protein